MVGVLTMLGIQTSFEYYFVGTHSYKDILSFVHSSYRCGFIPWTVSSNISKYFPPKVGDPCMLFMITVQDYYKQAQISSVRVRYITSGRQYNFVINPHLCKPDLQNVEWMLVCHGETVNGTICKRNETCERKEEVCQGYVDDDHGFCMPERHIYEPCDEYSHCEKKSVCKLSGHTRLCQCISDYEDIDGRCVKGSLKLGETCTYAKQCTGTKHASECLYNHESDTKMCSCMKDYVASSTKCISGGLLLHDLCEENVQCSGTKNAQNCKKYNHNLKSTCGCMDGYIENHAECLKIQADVHVSWLGEKANQLLLIAIGGYFGMAVCLFATLVLVLERRGQSTKRQTCSNCLHPPPRDAPYSNADLVYLSNLTQATVVNQQNDIQNQSENIYDEASQSVKQEADNDYKYTESFCQWSDNDTYNHLHQKPPMLLSDDLYGLPKTVFTSVSTPVQDN